MLLVEGFIWKSTILDQTKDGIRTLSNTHTHTLRIYMASGGNKKERGTHSESLRNYPKENEFTPKGTK